MTNVIKTKSNSCAYVEVKGRQVLDDIVSNFDVFTRADDVSEIIMDTCGIEDDSQRANELCKILAIDPQSDQAEEIINGGMVVLYS